MAFTDPTYAVNTIQSLADQPTETASQLKTKFDLVASDTKTYLTAHNTELEAVTDGSSGADSVGATQLANNGSATETVQTQMEDLDTAIGDRQYTNDNVVTDSESVTASIDALDTADIQNVKITGNQTVAGTKTFSSNVVIPATPTLDTHATSKGYVDNLAPLNIADDSITNAKMATDVKIGSLAALTTDDQDSVTDAINEIDAIIDNSFNADANRYIGNVKAIIPFEEEDDTGITLAGGAYGTTGAKVGNDSYGADDVGATKIFTASFASQQDLTELSNGVASSTADYIRLPVTISGTVPTFLTIEFSSDNAGADVNVNEYQYNASVASGFQVIEVAKSAFTSTGSPDWSDIGYIRLITTGSDATTDVWFDYMQLVKKDPTAASANPCQYQGTTEITINSGEWFVGRESGRNIIKTLDLNTDGDALIEADVFNDFIATVKITASDAGNRRYLAWFTDDDNYVRCSIESDVFKLRVRESASNTDKTVAFAIDSNDSTSFKIAKLGTSISASVYKNNDVDDIVELISTTTLTSGKLALGTYSGSQAYYDGISITKIPHAHHASIAEISKNVVNTWDDYTPTLTFTGTPPGSITTVARYNRIGHTVSVNISLSSADGNGATDLQISLPVTPRDNNSIIAVNSLEKVDTTWSNPLGYIDDDGGNGIEFKSFSTATDAVAWEMIVTGSYEV